jgi:hypothetical protein
MKKYLFLDDERMPRDVTWVFIGGVGSWGTGWQKGMTESVKDQISASCDQGKGKKRKYRK